MYGGRACAFILSYDRRRRRVQTLRRPNIIIYYTRTLGDTGAGAGHAGARSKVSRAYKGRRGKKKK